MIAMIPFFGVLLLALSVGAFFTDYFNWWGW